MSEIPEELLTRLDALAAAVGASGKLIWETLVAAGFVKGIVSVIFIFFCFGLIYGSSFLWKWGVAWNAEEYKANQYNNDVTGIMAMVGAAAGIIGGIIGSTKNITGLIYLFVPEYYAAERLLQLLN